VPDTQLGLPMDALYGQELKELRKRYSKLCEVVLLASENKENRAFSFFKVIVDFARDMIGADLMCIVVNPQYNLAYKRLLFQDLGGLKFYDRVNGAPAVAKYLEISRVKKDRLKTPVERFKRKFIFGPEDIPHFTFESYNPDRLQYINKCYRRILELRSHLTI